MSPPFAQIYTDAVPACVTVTVRVNPSPVTVSVPLLDVELLVETVAVIEPFPVPLAGENASHELSLETAQDVLKVTLIVVDEPLVVGDQDVGDKIKFVPIYNPSNPHVNAPQYFIEFVINPPKSYNRLVLFSHLFAVLAVKVVEFIQVIPDCQSNG